MSCRSNDGKTEKAVPVATSTGSNQPPAARQFAAWLVAFDAADRAALASWREKNFPYGTTPGPPANIDDELGFRQRTGGFDLQKTEESSATQFVALVKEKSSDQLARVSIEVDAAEPHRVTKFEVHAIPTPDELRPKRMSEADAIAALRAELDKEVTDDRFAGAVVVAKNGTPIFAQAYGLADRDKKIPNKLDTQFRIGSMNKMFTATAILQLVQTGRLALADSLGKIVHDYPNQSVASKVTIHQLLTHTGGTGDIFGPEFDAHRLELRTLDDYVKLYGKRDFAFDPGSRWEYSNYGFLLLGVVIERATGKSYYDWVSEHVFTPAGMTATGSLPEDQRVPDRAVGYMKATPTASWAPNTDTLPYRGTSAGGGYSTVNDLLRFANAITSHQLLDAKHTDLLTTGKIDTPNGGKYGYGFGEDSSDGVRCVGHGGGAPGMNGDLQICDSGYTIAVLSNLDPPTASRISDFIRHRLPVKAP
jgi:D-alanyl-D-alanine carboxypeptidase